MENLTAGFPVVTQASEVALTAGRGPRFTRVESRMVLGCTEGQGTVTINGSRFSLQPKDLLVLPWAHAIAYDADLTDPFFVYGLHLLPWHAADEPVELVVPHDPRHPLTGVPWRADRPLGVEASAGAGGVAVGTVAARPGLAALVRYAIGRGQHGLHDAAIARALGTLALTELDQPIAPPHIDDTALPAAVRRLTTWVDAHLHEPIDLSDLARVLDRGTTTLNRLCTRHLHRSPLAYVGDRRIDRARELLAAGQLPVAQVGRRCGYDDPYYFSRVFRERTGESPRAWRSRSRLP